MAKAQCEDASHQPCEEGECIECIMLEALKKSIEGDCDIEEVKGSLEKHIIEPKEASVAELFGKIKLDNKCHKCGLGKSLTDGHCPKCYEAMSVDGKLTALLKHMQNRPLVDN